MPRSLQEIMDQAESLSEHFQDGFTPDASPEVAALRAAVHRRSQAEADLTTAVAQAIAAGQSWGTVGRTVGTSPQAARERYKRFTVPAGGDEPAAAAVGEPAAQQPR